MLVGCLSGVCLGAEFRRTDPGHGRLTVYLGSTAEARDAAESLARVLKLNGLDPGECGLRVERIDDGRWVERYQAALRPFPMGRRFCVAPGGPGDGLEGRRSITLVPDWLTNVAECDARSACRLWTVGVLFNTTRTFSA